MKKLIIAITGLITLGFAAIVIAVLFLANLDLNDYKDWINEQFYQQTGRELTINGNIEHSLYPWLGMQVENVIISNPDGFSEADFLNSEYAAFRIRLMPLFSQSYEIDTIELRNTTVNLEVNAAGENNWTFAADGDNAEDEAPPAADNEDFAFNQLIIGGVAISGVTVNYVNAVENRSLNAENINLDIPRLVYGEPLDLAMSMNLRSLNPTLESAINLSSTVIYDLDSNDYALQDLSLDFLDSSMLADIASNDGQLSGTLRISTQRSADIFALAGQAELAQLISTIDLSVDIAGNGESMAINPLDLNLGLSAGPRLSRAATVNLNLLGELDMAGSTLQLERFAFNGLGLALNGSLDVESLQNQPVAAGTISLDSFNPRELAALLRIELPPTRDAAVLGNLALSTAFSAGSDFVELNNLTLVLDDSTITGSLGAGSLSNADYAFDLDIDSMDVDRYLAPETAQDNNPEATAGGDLPLEPLRNFSLDGALSIAELGISGLSLSQVQVNVSADQGLISLDPVSAALYAGSYGGSLSLDARSDVPAFSMRSNLQNIDLAPLSMDFMDASYVSGRGNISMALNGRGSGTRDIIESLNGTADLAVNDGIFYGVDVGAVLAQLETMLQSRRMLNVNRGEQTAFDNLSATINIAGGVARTENLLIQAPGFNISGNGVLANLQNNTIDFDLLANVDAASATLNSEQFDVGGYSVPIACTGTMNAPRCLPDLEGILQSALSGAIQREVGGLLDRLLGGEDEEQQNDADNLTEESPEQEQEESDPAAELLNRALDSLFR